MNATISLEMPVSIAEHLAHSWGDLSRRILETVAVEAYRTNTLTAYEIQELLGFSSRWQTNAFLKDNQVYLHYNEDDLASDLHSLRLLIQR